MNHCRLPDKLLPPALHSCVEEITTLDAALPNSKSAGECGGDGGGSCMLEEQEGWY